MSRGPSDPWRLRAAAPARYWHPRQRAQAWDRLPRLAHAGSRV